MSNIKIINRVSKNHWIFSNRLSSFDVCQSIYGSIDKCEVVIAGLSVGKINGGAACTFIKTEKRLSDFEQAFLKLIDNVKTTFRKMSCSFFFFFTELIT